jgi:hypothetical protein
MGLKTPVCAKHVRYLSTDSDWLWKKNKNLEVFDNEYLKLEKINHGAKWETIIILRQNIVNTPSTQHICIKNVKKTQSHILKSDDMFRAQTPIIRS